MVYKNSLVAVVKCRGKILRENDGFVTLPFGSEYSLLFKNLSTQRASIKVSIDGQDVLDGHSMIVKANSEEVLKGFLKDSLAKNAFKFIKKTEEIVEHRGDKIDDGMIRIEFCFEKQKEVDHINIMHDHYHHHFPVYPEYHYHYYYHPFRYEFWTNKTSNNEVSYNSSIGSNSMNNDINCSNMNSKQELMTEQPIINYMNQIHEDEGITVKGNEVNQHFEQTWIGPLTNPEVIIIKLRGITLTGKVVEEPITVSDKRSCKTCGKQSPTTNKFCPNCGTFLE
jgi:hypothetical protein